MGWDDELLEATKLMERVKRRATDDETLRLCDFVLRLVQRDAMSGVSLSEQEKVLEPIPSEGTYGTKKPWTEQGISRSEYYRRNKGED